MIGTGYRYKIRDKKSEVDPANLPLVVAFSGGRTSGMMLRRLLDTEREMPIVLFANTGKERDETLDFVNEVSTQWKVPVIWLQLTKTKVDLGKVRRIPSVKTRKNLLSAPYMLWYEEVTYATAKRHTDNDTPFDRVISCRQILPNAVSRYCSSEMKVRTMQRYLWDNGIYSFRNAIGFRSDEPDRAYDLIYSSDRNKKCHLEFPLMNLGVTEPDVRSFWKQQSFDLRLESYEGNCHLCFLKKKRSLLTLVKEQPELAKWWSDAEKQKSQTTKTSQGGQFNRNFTIEQLIEQAFEFEPTEEDKQDAMQCACTTSMSLSEMEE